MGRIVVGVDGSPVATAALRWAVDEARTRGWDLDAVVAWTLPPSDGIVGTWPGTTGDELHDAAANTLDVALSEVDATGVAVRRHVACSVAHQAIEDLA